MKQINFTPRNLIGIMLIFVVMLNLTGCEPLRKKFIREKKNDQSEESLAVLDPIDYPARMVNAGENYAYHFSMWNVWQKDFMNLLAKETNEKRKQHTIGQVLLQLKEMKRWLNIDKAAELDKIIGRYEIVLSEVSQPIQFQQLNKIRRSCLDLQSDIKNNFNPKQITDYLLEKE